MRVDINGNPLEVEVLGDHDTALVMIVHHGAPGLGSRAEPRTSFGPFSDVMRVLIFDARGSGASGLTPPYSHEQYIADVDALREWVGAERIVMAGGSYGGFVSMEYAIAHPDRGAGPGAARHRGATVTGWPGPTVPGRSRVPLAPPGRVGALW